jgi:hypothetical protein
VPAGTSGTGGASGRFRRPHTGVAAWFSGTSGEFDWELGTISASMSWYIPRRWTIRIPAASQDSADYPECQEVDYDFDVDRAIAHPDGLPQLSAVDR